MLVDLLFVVAVVGLLVAIYKLKFSKESITREIEEEAANLKKREEQRRQEEESNRVKEEARAGGQTGTTSEVGANSEGWQGESSDS